MSATFRIMISTDNHLGYQEKDPIRKHDSFLAFEEVLSQAINYNSDFLLLGGDLFHDHNPSKYTLNRTLRLFDQFVTGNRKIPFETLSASQNLNYMNPCIRIKLPVFIIHGNHDDPSSDTNISSINIMQSANYLNYITCENQEDKLVVKPVILQKGDTLIGIYGIGNIKEERLNRLIKSKQIIYEYSENGEECFNILVIHQNRFKGHGLGATARNCVMD